MAGKVAGLSRCRMDGIDDQYVHRESLVKVSMASSVDIWHGLQRQY